MTRYGIRKARRRRFTPSKVNEARRVLAQPFVAKQNGDDDIAIVAEMDAKPILAKRFRIVPDGAARFYTVVVDRDGRKLSVPSISISEPEGLSHTVTYSMRDRVTGSFVGQIAEEMEKLGYEHMKRIIVFTLPKNDRGAEYVVYDFAYVEELDG